MARAAPPDSKGFSLMHPSVYAKGRRYYAPIITKSGNHPRRFEETEYGKGGWRFAPATVSVVSDALLCKVSERGICQGHPRRRRDSTLFWPLEVETDNNGARLSSLISSYTSSARDCMHPSVLYRVADQKVSHRAIKWAMLF